MMVDYGEIKQPAYNIAAVYPKDDVSAFSKKKKAGSEAFAFGWKASTERRYLDGGKK